MKSRIIRNGTESHKIIEVACLLKKLERDLLEVCAKEANPITLKGQGELAKLHVRLRKLRAEIEMEGGL